MKLIQQLRKKKHVLFSLLGFSILLAGSTFYSNANVGERVIERPETSEIYSQFETNGAVKVSWDSYKDAKLYILLKNKKWHSIYSSKDLSFHDTDIEAGKEYRYDLVYRTKAKKYVNVGSTTFTATKSGKSFDGSSSTQVNNSGDVELSWDKKSDAIIYIVKRNKKAIARLNPDISYYLDTDVTPGEEYEYTVYAYSRKAKKYHLVLKENVTTTGASCPNAIIEDGEECDDGNSVDGCSATCEKEETEQTGFRVVSESVFPIKGTLTKDEIRVQFTFSEVAQAYIEYGTSNNFGNSTNEETSFKYSTHKQWIRDLKPNTQYHYRIHGMSQDGQKTVSDTYTFKTLGAGEVSIVPVCGNNKVETGEQCDDGNTKNGDGCTKVCKKEVQIAPVCGNNKVETGEQCDDGNTKNGDGCNQVCQDEEEDKEVDNPDPNPGGISSEDYVGTFYNQDLGGIKMTYEQIASNAPSQYNLRTHEEYLGEYLRQNPNVAWWNQNKSTETIEPSDAPNISGKVVNISPSGSNDTKTILNAIKEAGKGGVVDGGSQTFTAGPLTLQDFAEGVTLRNMNIEATGGSIFAKIITSDVSFINVHIDFRNRDLSYGIQIHPVGHRFSLVNSSMENAINDGGASAFVRVMHDVEDTYIVNNSFKNYISRDKGTSIIIRAIRYGGINGKNASEVAKRGITASNYFENFQSNEQGSDAEAFAAGGFRGKNQFDGQHLFLANVGVNAGKRLVKAQSGGITLHSNFNWWKDAKGPVGTRATRAHVAAHAVSDIYVTNNTFRTDNANPASEAILFNMGTRIDGWSEDQDYETHDIVFSHNVYELNSDTKQGRLHYGLIHTDYDKGKSEDIYAHDSEFSHNVIRGSGELKYYYRFRRGKAGNGTKPYKDPYGTGFKHGPNTINVGYSKSEYRTK